MFCGRLLVMLRALLRSAGVGWGPRRVQCDMLWSLVRAYVVVGGVGCVVVQNAGAVLWWDEWWPRLRVAARESGVNLLGRELPQELPTCRGNPHPSHTTDIDMHDDDDYDYDYEYENK